MCGIAWARSSSALGPAGEKELCELLRRRGPDFQRIVDAGELGVFYAAVLHLRGAEPCAQPAEDAEGNILCFNGEVYSFATTSEAPVLLRGLARSCASGDDVALYLSSLAGPWSLIYAHRKTGRVFFARDPVGRRSLLLGRASSGDISAIGSVSAGNQLNWEECPPTGVYCYDAHERNLSHFSWPRENAPQRVEDVSRQTSAAMSTDTTLPSKDSKRLCRRASLSIEACVDALEHALQRAVLARVSNVAAAPTKVAAARSAPGAACSTSKGKASTTEATTAAPLQERAVLPMSRATRMVKGGVGDAQAENDQGSGQRSAASSAIVAILFSGGVDCTVLAAMVHRCVDRTKAIDLLNVCFDTPSHQSPDRLGAIFALRCLRTRFPRRQWRLVLIDRSAAQLFRDETSRNGLARLVHPKQETMDFSIGATLLSAAEARGRLLVDPAEERKLYGCAVKALLVRRQDVMTSSKHAVGGAPSRDEARALFRELQPFLGKRTSAAGKARAPAAGSGSSESVQGGARCANDMCGKISKHRCHLFACKRCCRKATVLLSGHLPEHALNRDQGERSKLVVMSRVLRLEWASSICDCPVHRLRKEKEHTNAREKDGNEKARPRASVAVGADDSLHATFGTLVGKRAEADMTASAHPERRHLTTENVRRAHRMREDSCFESGARVLLSGLGADEQLGGYGRHRTARLKGGWEAFERELEKDVSRLWERNLGRDGRCLSDSGREARYPFLDEEVMRVISTFPVETLLDCEKPRGVGDKIVLRKLAEKLGLGGEAGVAFVPKRAIQFGTRIAQKINTSAFGSNSKGSGKTVLDLAALAKPLKRVAQDAALAREGERAARRARWK